MSAHRPVFLEVEVLPQTGPSAADRLTVVPPIRALLPLFDCPFMVINQDPVTGRTQVMLANGSNVSLSEKYFDLRARLIQGAQVILKGPVVGEES